MGIPKDKDQKLALGIAGLHEEYKNLTAAYKINNEKSEQIQKDLDDLYESIAHLQRIISEVTLRLHRIEDELGIIYNYGGTTDD